jgi:hypothetical protein
LFNIDRLDTEGNIVKIKGFIDTRWVTSSEAMWRIFGFTLCENHHLAVAATSRGHAQVTFKAGENLNDIFTCDRALKSMLKEYFHG